MLTNDQARPVPQTEFAGPLLTFDLAGLLIGVAEYAEGPTGCTVFSFPQRAATAIDARGGAVATVGNYEWNHAICLAGGSLYGLTAASGVAEELFIRHGHSLENFALVSGAIIFDYGARDNVIYPDPALGRAAVRAARPGVFPLGRRGAGRSAGVGAVFDRGRGEPSGQAGAFRAIGPTKVAVFAVVNALGVIVDRQGRVVARIIQPFHTLMDGDVLYAVTTNEVENAALSPVALGIVAAELMWDAILTMAHIVAGEG
jgi:L-aminopeptidase/D-esterase-like protein